MPRATTAPACTSGSTRQRGPKRLVWTEGSQIDFYDQPPQVGAALEAAKAWFDETLRA
jgi:hypothetical protein